VKAIVNTAPGELTWMDRPLPEPGQGQVRIRTATCGICATDLAMIDGWDRTGFPSIPGHEWSGVVDALGTGADDALRGRPCVAENVLTDGGEVGFEHPGGYGQFLLTEAANVHVLPDGFPMEQAALTEPLAVCVRAMRRLHMARTESALVLGDGVIGLLMLVLLKRAGVATLAMVGGRPARLALAGEFGAECVLNYHDAARDLDASVAGMPGHPFANVIEASGSAAALVSAMGAAAREGKVLVVGDYDMGRADFAWNDLMHRELDLIGSCASAGAWAEAVSLATSGAVPLDRLISHHVRTSDYAHGIERARNDRDALKVVLDWREEPL